MHFAVSGHCCKSKYGLRHLTPGGNICTLNTVRTGVELVNGVDHAFSIVSEGNGKLQTYMSSKMQ